MKNGFIPFKEKYWQFRNGMQFTIRRGVKSYNGTECVLVKLDENGKITDDMLHVKICGIQHIRFSDIDLGDIVCWWHLQPAVPCRTKEGIMDNTLKIMRDCYDSVDSPTFLPTEIVSLVWFKPTQEVSA